MDNEPQFGQKADKDNPGVLNGQEYYPGQNVPPAGANYGPNAGQSANGGPYQPPYQASHGQNDAGQQPYQPPYQGATGQQSTSGQPPYQGATGQQPTSGQPPYQGATGQQAAPGQAGYPQGGYYGQPSGGQGGNFQPINQGSMPLEVDKSQLPSRTWPIITLVIGIAMMIIVAPAIVVGGIFKEATQIATAVNNNDAGLFIPVVNDEEFNVENPMTVAIFVVDDGMDWDCVVKDKNGKEISVTEDDTYSGLNPGRDFDESWTGTAKLKAGKYSVICKDADGNAATGIVVGNGDKLEEMIMVVVWAMVIGALMGFIGLVLTVVGVIWLVKRNGKRRKVLEQLRFQQHLSMQ